MIDETQKILNSEIDVFATCVRVPVFVGHAESVFIETKKKIDLKKLIVKIKSFSGLSLVDEKIDGGYVTPDEQAGEDEVFISRMRIKNDFNIVYGLSQTILEKVPLLIQYKLGKH